MDNAQYEILLYERHQQITTGTLTDAYSQREREREKERERERERERES